jgi:hypothetical protein
MFLDLLWCARKGMTKETTFSFRSDGCTVQLAFSLFLADSILAFFSLLNFALGLAFSAVLVVRLKVGFISFRTLTTSVLAYLSNCFVACLSAWSTVVRILLEVLLGLADSLALIGSIRAFAFAVLACLPTLALVSASSAVIVILLEVLRGLAFIAAEHGLVGRALALPMLAYLSFLALLVALAAVVNVLRKVGFLSVRAFASTTHALFSLLDVALISTSWAVRIRAKFLALSVAIFWFFIRALTFLVLALLSSLTLLAS